MVGVRGGGGNLVNFPNCRKGGKGRIPGIDYGYIMVRKLGVRVDRYMLYYPDKSPNWDN